MLLGHSITRKVFLRSLLDIKFKKLKLYKLNLNKNKKLLGFIRKIEPDYIFDFASMYG